MLESASQLFQKREHLQWDDTDVRHFVQRWLQEQLKTEDVHCESVRGREIVVRAPSPAARCMVLLLQYDLLQALKGAGGDEDRAVRVIS